MTVCRVRDDLAQALFRVLESHESVKLHAWLNGMRGVAVRLEGLKQVLPS